MKSKKHIAIIIVIIAVLAICLAYSFAKKNAEKKLQTTIKGQLSQLVNELEITLARHAYLPSLLANDNEISGFLKTPQDSPDYKEKQANINLSLEIADNLSGSTNIFLMNTIGEVISSSNWAEQDSFIAQNFSSWPYFEQANYNALGRHFSPQTEDDERYYYFARSVQFKNKVIGIIAVQIQLTNIAFDWTLSDIDFVVTDDFGVIFLSSNKAWNLRTISAFDPIISDTQKRNKDKLQSLNSEKVDLKYQGFQLIKLQNKEYQMLSQRMELAGWDVRVLSKYSIAKKEISRNVLLSTLLILLLAVLAGLILKILSQRKEFRQRARIELENKVRERTKALKKSQEDLIQAAKMAALGQLSTGITHEINNPLTAIRAYADNAEQFLKKDRLDMVESNLNEITKLTENLAAITGQLKSFARKSKGELVAVNVDSAINNAISIVHSKVISSGTQIEYNKSSSSDSQMVLADEIWLSQILINLISNAISATNNNTERNIWIDVVKNDQISIEIRDNGSGIDESNLPRIFEPFFTTKPTTKGLGLGLSISFNLAKEMNGSLIARNRVDSGALFTLCLPSAD